MTHLHTRFALMRADGRWFKHPNELNPTEWTPHLQEAHLWVDLDACKAAAYINWQFRCEDVLPLEIWVSPDGQRIQARQPTAGDAYQASLGCCAATYSNATA